MGIFDRLKGRGRERGAGGNGTAAGPAPEAAAGSGAIAGNGAAAGTGAAAGAGGDASGGGRGWAALPPIQRAMLAPARQTVASADFGGSLTTWQNHSFSGTLSHAVLDGAPTGLIKDTLSFARGSGPGGPAKETLFPAPAVVDGGDGVKSDRGGSDGGGGDARRPVPFVQRAQGPRIAPVRPRPPRPAPSALTRASAPRTGHRRVLPAVAPGSVTAAPAGAGGAARTAAPAPLPAPASSSSPSGADSPRPAPRSPLRPLPPSSVTAAAPVSVQRSGGSQDGPRRSGPAAPPAAAPPADRTPPARTSSLPVQRSTASVPGPATGRAAVTPPRRPLLGPRCSGPRCQDLWFRRPLRRRPLRRRPPHRCNGVVASPAPSWHRPRQDRPRPWLRRTGCLRPAASRTAERGPYRGHRRPGRKLRCVRRQERPGQACRPEPVHPQCLRPSPARPHGRGWALRRVDLSAVRRRSRRRLPRRRVGRRAPRLPAAPLSCNVPRRRRPPVRWRAP